MSKHKHLLEHREIENICLTDDGGLIIRFSDESHTYIHPDIFKDVWLKYNQLFPFFNEEE